MALIESADDKLKNAIECRQQQVRLEHVVGSLDAVFRRALAKDRRLFAYLESYEAEYMKTGLFQVMYNYTVTIHYSEFARISLNEILIDSSSFDVQSLFVKGKFRDRAIITDDAEALRDKFTDYLPEANALYEGYNGFRFNYLSNPKLSPDYVVKVALNCMMENENQLRRMQGRTNLECRRIWNSILGRANVPKFALPFLAFSWITQECVYDQRAYDEVESNPGGVPSDPAPLTGYGPLVEKRGICGGFAWAFKWLMDIANVECICISGFLKDDLKVGHQWCLVKFSGQYYHVDPTWGSKNSGVNVEKYMQPDSVMKTTHIWKEDRYPKATGSQLDYDFLEDYLAENGSEYLDDGADEKYMFPDEIID